jgi:hypothetical protein
MALPAEPKPDSRPTMLSREEGHELFDYVARKTVGMSGPEFLARYDAGEIEEPGDETSEDHALRGLIMLIPFGR